MDRLLGRPQGIVVWSFDRPQARQRRPPPSDQWHLDEMVVRRERKMATVQISTIRPALSQHPCRHPQDFNVQRHLVSRATLRNLRDEAKAQWLTPASPRLSVRRSSVTVTKPCDACSKPGLAHAADRKRTALDVGTTLVSLGSPSVSQTSRSAF